MSEQPELSAEEVERALHHTKNRIAAVDITRILAALIVMFSHLQNFKIGGDLGLWIKYLDVETIGTCSSVFFLFAGYFACRNITWKKALDNSLWCLLPFLLWVAIAGVIIANVSAELWKGQDNPSSWLGIHTITTFYVGNNTPVNGPLWFMRDLVFLFLLSPILYRNCRWIFPLIVLLSIVPGLDRYFEAMAHKTLSPYSIGFFTLGCYLRTLTKERQQWFLKFHSPLYLWVFFLMGLTMGGIRIINGCFGAPNWSNPFPWLADMIWDANTEWYQNVWNAALAERHWTFIPAMLSIWALYQLARCIEVHCPRLTQWALKLAPVTFLTFAAHWPIYAIFYETPIRGSWWLCLLPFFVFALMTLFFFALKRWARPLLHLVAHYKLRPDDK